MQSHDLIETTTVSTYEEPVVTKELQTRIDELVEEIDISNAATSISYGVKPMEEISRFSDSLLTGVKNKTSSEVSNQLTELILKVREYDPLSGKEVIPKGFLSKIPFLRKIISKTEHVKINHMELTSQVDVITSHLDNSMINLIHDNEKLEELYLKNFDFYKDLNTYVLAGKKKIEQVRKERIPYLKQKADESKDLLDAQILKDEMEHLNRFERRINDLEISKTISMQTAPQIRIIQNNNQQLVEKIQSSILSTIPIWKSQIVLANALDEQQKAVSLQKDVSDTTNNLLRRNAELLQNNSIATAQEVERSIVDIETIRDVQNSLVGTIEETMKIAAEGRVKRIEVEKELATMEDDLRKRITSVVDKYSQ